MISPTPHIGFALNTKDRVQLTAQILPGLDCGGFDLIWCDGSTTEQGRSFPSARFFRRTGLKEIRWDVTGGPDAAIQFSLRRLLALGYDYVGLIENDVLLKPGWLPALLAAWRRAQAEGFEVGAGTVHSLVSRVLARGSNYVVPWNVGAGMVLFSREAAQAVLDDYQTTNAQRIQSFFQSATGVDLAPVWELFKGQPERELGAGWHFALSAFKHGLISVGTIPHYAASVDMDMEEVGRTRYVHSAAEPLPAHCLSAEQLKAALHQLFAPPVHNFMPELPDWSEAESAGYFSPPWQFNETRAAATVTIPTALASPATTTIPNMSLALASAMPAQPARPKLTANFATILETATSRATLERLYRVYSTMEPSAAQPPDGYRDAEALSRAGYCSAKQVLAAVFELAAPKNYLEIGTRRGHSLCLAACSATQPFDVYSFDLWIPNYGGEANPGPDLIRRELAKFGFAGQFNVSLGDSRKTVPEFFANPAHPQLFDVIYVDGDHSDEGARIDLENTVAHLAPGGFLLFDDITHPKHLTLLNVWKEFVARHPELEDLVETRYEYGWALARRRAGRLSVAAQLASTSPFASRTTTGTFQLTAIQNNSIARPQSTALTTVVSAHSQVAPSAATRCRHIVISGTNFWNPGDDFVRDGIIRILRESFPGELLNFLFYNFNADFFPQSKFSGIADFVSDGDLEKYRDDIDAIVIAGLPVGDEMKDLYYWITANGLEDKVHLLGAGYESKYVAEHISQEPEATIFRKARLVTGRTAKAPEFLKTEKIAYHHINCPAMLSVPAVKQIPAGKQIERIGFSIQLPHGDGVPNHTCAVEMYDLSVQVLRELSRQYPVEVVAHHKSEYFHFVNLLRDDGIPVVFSSFYRDLFAVYPRYDLMITTRLHASLFANGHGIPGIIINDTDRHTHTLEGFLHSSWVNNQAGFEQAFARWQAADLAAVARELEKFKSQLLSRYLEVVRPVLAGAKKSAAKSPRRASPNSATLVRRVEYGNGVHLQEGSTRWVANRGEILLPSQHFSEPVNLTFELSAGDLWCYGKKNFQTVIRLDGLPVKQVCFTQDGQRFEVKIPLEPKPHGQVLTIESDASFVPAQIDDNSRDQRGLAVKLAKLTLEKLAQPAPATAVLHGVVEASGRVQNSVPPAVAHRPEFLWSPTRNELITTKFMRNRVLFSTLADRLLPELRKQKGGPLKILFWACSIGCEPYTMKFLLGPASMDEIVGVDCDAEAVRQANQAVYHPGNWTLFFDEQKSLLTPEEVSRLFERLSSAEDEFRVTKPYRENLSFQMVDLFSTAPVVPFKGFDVVVCNNLLLHMKSNSASLAWDCLYRYLNDDGLLVVGGCNPSVKLESAKRLSLQPCTEALSEISKHWSGVSGAWNFNPRPAWAYPAPDENNPDYPFLAGEIFRKIKPAR